MAGVYGPREAKIHQRSSEESIVTVHIAASRGDRDAGRCVPRHLSLPAASTPCGRDMRRINAASPRPVGHASRLAPSWSAPRCLPRPT